MVTVLFISYNTEEDSNTKNEIKFEIIDNVELKQTLESLTDFA